MRGVLSEPTAGFRRNESNSQKGEGVNDPTDRRRSEPEPSFAEMVDNAVRRVATSIAIAGIAIALAIYARPGPSRFEAFATEGGIVRVDTRSGDRKSVV